MFFCHASDMVEMIGRYRLVRQLGQGGMGTVWLAEDNTGQRAAVKVINTDLAREPQFRERFRQEVHAAQRVRRFCTAPVLDAGLDQDPLWVATDYIDGPTLHQAVTAHGPLRGADLDALAVGIATALTAIHQAQIIHRDLKPSNVLLSPVGPRVIDFGIARALDATTRLTRTGTVIGTPGYIAPELLAGAHPLPAADVFCWGAVIAYAGTGRPAFTANNGTEINDRVQHAEPDLDGLEPHLRRLAARALAKDPAARPTVPQLLAELTGPPPTPPQYHDPRTRHLTTPHDSRAARHIAPYAALTAILLLTTGAVALTLTASDANTATKDRPAAAPPTTATTTPAPPTSTQPATTPTPRPPALGPGPITNTASGLCIDTDGPQGPGVGVQVRDCGNFSGQQWRYDQATHHLTNPPSGLCLDTAGAPAGGVGAILNRCGNRTGQGWRHDPATGRLTNLSSGLCLDTSRPAAPFVALVLRPCGGGTGQDWRG
ncbi:serine/threonine protein kinase [Actinomadura macrotermitis]|uniref:non-specific serine/threonine protein kinase n=1 Tax=Actinomadura macrotermitis TaxID=2585200 RepID=A0A7K0C7L0_9ACTN|nr:Serine/threonine-protein kinase PknD [Actinomadura macrotermitis]